MKIDLVGPRQRGLAMGFNEAAGYSAVALTAVVAGHLVANYGGLFPILFARHGLPVDRIGILVAVYPAVWGVGQMLTGALSDRWGRKHLITAGMFTQAAALALIAIVDSFGWWAAAAISVVSGLVVAVRMYETHTDHCGAA